MFVITRNQKSRNPKAARILLDCAHNGINQKLSNMTCGLHRFDKDRREFISLLNVKKQHNITVLITIRHHEKYIIS